MFTKILSNVLLIVSFTHTLASMRLGLSGLQKTQQTIDYRELERCRMFFSMLIEAKLPAEYYLTDTKKLYSVIQKTITLTTRFVHMLTKTVIPCQCKEHVQKLEETSDKVNKLGHQYFLSCLFFTIDIINQRGLLASDHIIMQKCMESQQKKLSIHQTTASGCCLFKADKQCLVIDSLLEKNIRQQITHNECVELRNQIELDNERHVEKHRWSSEMLELDGGPISTQLESIYGIDANKLSTDIISRFKTTVCRYKKTIGCQKKIVNYLWKQLILLRQYLYQTHMFIYHTKPQYKRAGCVDPVSILVYYICNWRPLPIVTDIEQDLMYKKFIKDMDTLLNKVDRQIHEQFPGDKINELFIAVGDENVSTNLPYMMLDRLPVVSKIGYLLLFLLLIFTSHRKIDNFTNNKKIQNICKIQILELKDKVHIFIRLVYDFVTICVKSFKLYAYVNYYTVLSGVQKIRKIKYSIIVYVLNIIRYPDLFVIELYLLTIFELLPFRTFYCAYLLEIVSVSVNKLFDHQPCC